MHRIDIENFEQLREYLLRAGRIPADETAIFTRLAGGVSNRTVRVDCAGQSFVIKQALPKLRVETEWLSDPRRIEQEARGLIWLERLAPPGTITPLLFQDPEQHLLAMAAVPPPHENWKTALLAGRIDENLVRQFGALLGRIHQRSADDREQLAVVFDDREFFRSLRLDPYYRFAASRNPAAAEFFEQLIAETWAARICLVHGDYSPKNVLVFRGQLVLLDHEVIHFGDPTFDIGFSLTHLLSKAHHLPDFRNQFLKAAGTYWGSYLPSAGPVGCAQGFEERAVRQTLGCLLARIDGRSPLEYLSSAERARQRAIVLELIERPPQAILELIQTFGQKLGTYQSLLK